MKIAIVAPVWIKIPPHGYGGIEWIVKYLADGMTDKGHEVTLFASGDSETKARLVSVYPEEQRNRMGQLSPAILHALNAYKRAEEFDIVHDHTWKEGPALGSYVGSPVLHTLHGPFDEEGKKFYSLVSQDIYYNSISDYQRSCMTELNYIGTIYNGIDIENYPFTTQKEDYFLYLGRMNAEKAPHIAVEVAKRLNLNLIILGKIDSEEEQNYFDVHVKPHIGRKIRFIGEVSKAAKIEIVKEARCLLFPIQWAEPFGLVMIEAMASGTPVIGWKNGSVPEVVEDNVTGFVVDSVESMEKAISRLDLIDPMACRKRVEDNFTVQIMLDHYEKAYFEIVEREKERVKQKAIQY